MTLFLFACSIILGVFIPIYYGKEIEKWVDEKHEKLKKGLRK